MTTLALKLNTVKISTQTTAAVRPARRLLTWDLAGVLTLMASSASSAAYAVFTLSHLA